MLIPKASATINDIWHVVGLKGTGSDNYAIDDLFVPNAYTFTRESAADRRETGPLYRFTTFHLYGTGFAAIGLGLARGALDDFVALAATKMPKTKTFVLRDNAVIQSQVALAEAKLASSRSYLLQTLHETWATLPNAARRFRSPQRAALKLAGTYAVHQAKDVDRHRLSRRRRHRDLREQSVRAPLPRRAHRDPAGAGAVRQFRDGGAGAARPAEPVEADLSAG